MPQKVKCPKCDGAAVSRCPKCQGTGYTGHGERVEKCTFCGSGDGVIPCGRCNGKGFIEQ